MHIEFDIPPEFIGAFVAAAVIFAVLAAAYLVGQFLDRHFKN